MPLRHLLVRKGLHSLTERCADSRRLVPFSCPEPDIDRRRSRDFARQRPRDPAETDSLAEEDGFEPSVPRGETRARNPPLDSPECRSVVHQQTNSRL
jgi:hypothetical protein